MTARLLQSALFAACLLVINVCALPTEVRLADALLPRQSDGSDVNNDVDPVDWNFVQTSLNQSRFTAQPYVSNGYIGARLPAAGVGYQAFQPLSNNSEAFGQGWPIFGPRVTASMVAGFYDVQNSTLGTNFPQKGGEQVISLLPSWTQLYLTITSSSSNGTTTGGNTTELTYAPGVDNSTITSFSQSLSVRNGTVITEVQWQPQGVEQPITLRYTVIAHRSRPSLGMMRMQVTGLSNTSSLVVTDAFDGQAAMRTQNASAGNVTEGGPENTLYASVSPLGLDNVTAYLFSSLQSNNGTLGANASLPTSVSALLGLQNTSTAFQSYNVTGDGSGQVDVWKYVGIASTDAYGQDARSTALNAVSNATQSTWDALVQEHVQEWEQIWDEGGDIVIHDQSTPLLVRLQRQARASLFHLLSNVRRGDEGVGLGDNSIAPAGLTSDSYAGSIFWDAETFMFPTLSLLYPDYAESILNYRHKVPGQPERNAQQYGKPGILYPWVSARYQNCTGIGPCYDYEYHLNNDIALAHWQYYLQTRNQTFLEQLAFPIMQGVSQFWAAQVVQNAAGATLQGPNNETVNPPSGVNTYSTLNMTEPDEYANFKNNGAFTNAGLTTIMLDTLYAASLLNKSLDELSAQNWSAIANQITLLRENSSDIVLEFEGFNSTVLVKQADVPLLIYPLEYEQAYPEREPVPRADLDYYAGATDPAGPAMTYSIYGIASTQLDGLTSAQIGPTCEGFTRLLQAGIPYEREFGQLSEQINDDYSSNGGSNPAGGVNPAFTFLTGSGGLLQMYTHGFMGYRARNGSDDTLHLDPNLPPQLYGGLTIKGVHHAGVVLDVEILPNSTTVTYRNGSSGLNIEVSNNTYSLPAGSSVQLPTRTSATIADAEGDTAGNFALCSSIDDGSENLPENTTSNADSVLLMQQSHAGTNLPFGANDGSNATYFQPDRADQASSLVLDLGQTRSLSRVHLNFGSVPPQFISIAVAAQDNDTSGTVNSTARTYQTIIDRVAVNVSVPYDAQAVDVRDAVVHVPVQWNTTDLNLTSTTNSTSAGNAIQARYVNLTMEGVATPQDLGYGATLHEVQLF